MLREIVLFGAGASKDAGLPDAFELTEQIIETVSANPADPDAPVLSFVLGGLLYAEGVRGRNPLTARIDIEALFRAVHWLEARRTGVDPVPFVAAWQTRVLELDRLVPEQRGPFDLTPISAFGAAELRLLRELRRILWVLEPSVDYLQPLANLVSRQSDVTIVSLNYDNVVESFCRRVGIPRSSGVHEHGGYNPQIGNQLTWIASGVNLVKIHGSLNWALFSMRPARTPQEDGLCPHRFVMAWGDNAPDFASQQGILPAVLFGGESKVVTDEPFLDLFIRFRTELQRSDRLTIVGYSFRDAHVNAEIATFLNRRRDARVRIIDPNPREREGFLADVLASVSSRVEIVRKTAADGLPAL